MLSKDYIIMKKGFTKESLEGNRTYSYCDQFLTANTMEVVFLGPTCQYQRLYNSNSSGTIL